MKRIITAALLATAAYQPAMAAEDACKPMYDLAYIIMEKRQEGVPQHRLIDVVDGQFAGLIDIAYGETRWHTESRQTRAAEDFAEAAYLVCRGKQK